MSVLFIVTIVLAIVTVFLVVATIIYKPNDYDDWSGLLKAASTLAVVAVAILAVCSSLTSVPAKSIGVVTSFGKPVDSLSSGIHWKAPWARVTDMNGAIQTESHLGDKRTEIRLGNQSNAYVQNVVRWRINPEAAGQLFADYQEFDNISKSLVEPETSAALNSAFASYDPLAAVRADAGDTKVEVTTLDQIADSVKTSLAKRTGDAIVVESVIIQKVDFDDATQGRINAYQAEVGNTRIAVQKKQTAQAEADANKVLAQSVSDSPNVLVSKCLDQLAEMVNKGQPVPAGFSCWPGSSSQVIADGRK